MLKSIGASTAALAVFLGLVMPARPAYADGIREQEWHLAYLDIAKAHQFSKGGGITIAVIDSGVDASHPDLLGNVLPGAVTYAGPDREGSAWRDGNGHGTGMAGDIAAHGHGDGDSDGTVGIAPDAKVLPIADTSDSAEEGRGVTDAMAAGIDYAIAHKALVISISESVALQPDLVDAIQRAEDSNIVIVAAVGNRNDGDLTVAAPASLPGVIAAASVDRQGDHFADSVTGSAVLLAAPGVDIVHPAPGGGYAQGTGTSDAAAIIAGAVALVRAKYPNLSATEVIHRLTATATDKGPPGRDDEYGYGVINIVAALTADVPPLAPSVSPSPTSNDQPANNPSPTAQQPIRTRSALPFVIAAVAAVLVLLAVLGWWLVRRRGVSSP